VLPPGRSGPGYAKHMKHVLHLLCPPRGLRPRLQLDEPAFRSRQCLRETANFWKETIEAGDKGKIEKFLAGDRDKIEKAAQETLDWLFKNQFAKKDEFEAKQKVLEDTIFAILDKVGWWEKPWAVRCQPFGFRLQQKL